MIFKDIITVTYKGKEVLIFKDIDQISDYAIRKWEEISEEAIKHKGHLTVALSGGKTPLKLYQKLSDNKTLPWDKTHIFIVDERFVPYEHEESNYRMIDRTLLSHVSIPGENIHRISTEGVTPDDSAAKYEKDVIRFFRTTGIDLIHFDLILLGVGDDGHTASLFPGNPSIRETTHVAVAVTSTDMTKKQRITLTFTAINNSENIIFMATGINKAKVLKEVIEEGSSLPAAMVKPQKGKLFFLLDDSAGSLLSKN
jgi:6-phosphogluconolactonase